MTAAPDPEAVLWQPPGDADRTTALGRYLTWLRDHRGLDHPDYEAAWRWSTSDLPAFWSSVVEHLDVTLRTPPTTVLDDQPMPAARWFPGATLSYPEHALRRRGSAPAVIARSDTRPAEELSWDDLHDQVARCRVGLVRLGVGRGDRVAAYLPNGPEAVVAFLAAASLGAIWSSCPPEFGVRSVVDRFSQIDPTVLIAVSGYQYGDKVIDRIEELAAIRAELPTVTHTVHVPYAGPVPADSVPWGDVLAETGPLTFEAVPFDHPLYVLFSSGTTGLPKPIVHGHGGMLLEHAKYLSLHADLGPDDRFFWFTTTGWMMWNFLVSGLVVGSAIVLYDGDPGHPDLGTLWRVAADSGTTAFGVSASFLQACQKADLDPASVADLSRLCSLGSTGGPLPAPLHRWVSERLAGRVPVVSVSGGTDVCTAFVGAVPLLPIVAGEITGRCLGAAVDAYDSDGRSVVGTEGELVVTRPMPSMPVGFWGDEDGERYRAAYFDVYPGIWRHGDWMTITERGTCIISGRSDATLNRGGVRLGTAELYQVVESQPEVEDSLVVHLPDPAGGPGELLLFVQLAPSQVLDDTLVASIRRRLRAELSPRHVPDAVHVVPRIPRTHSGKKLEVPVKRILGGAAIQDVASPGALADPDALDAFAALAHER